MEPVASLSPDRIALTGALADETLQQSKCELLYSHGLAAIFMSAAIGAMLLFLMRDFVSQAQLEIWFGSAILVVVGRLALIAHWRSRKGSKIGRSAHYIRSFRVGALCSGALWGSTVILLYVPADLPHEVLLAFALAGLSAGGVTALAIDPVSAIGFLCLILLPMIIRLGGDAGLISAAMAVMGLLYLVFMIFVTVRVSRSLRENLQLRAEANRREGMLRERESALDKAQQVAQLGSFDLDLMSGEMRWSDEHYRQWGLLPGSVRPSLSLFRSHVPEEDLKQLNPQLEATLNTGTPFRCVHRVCLPNGTHQYIQSEAQLERDADGVPLRLFGTVQNITRARADQEEIRKLAFYDPLTQLPNRNRLLESLTESLDASERQGSTGALFFIDLDNFKSLNDTLGHAQGDDLLRQVAQRLQSCLRKSDTVARLGGDEFVILLVDLNGSLAEATRQASTIGEHILAALQSPYRLAGREHHSTSSVGVTLFQGAAVPVDDLLKRADLAMYQAKASGRNMLCMFTPELQAIASARSALEADLHLALRLQQFDLYYQGQVDANGRWLGAEALLRWKHPKRGFVPPKDVISVAEDVGLMVELGKWVLEKACQQLVSWSMVPVLSTLTVSVNVSARQFRHGNFVEDVLDIISRTGANPSLLNLELTESLLLDDVEEVIATMAVLRGHGLSFTLDDFGIGYSSLTYLKRLPLKQIKVDRSFVADIPHDAQDAAIVRLVVELGHSLGLSVVAEGVETREQCNFLHATGCQIYQGYLFSRPVPAEVFAAQVTDGRQIPAISHPLAPVPVQFAGPG